MNLGKVYKRLFEGKARSNDKSLTEAPMKRAFPRMKTDAERKSALEPGAGVPGQEQRYRGADPARRQLHGLAS